MANHILTSSSMGADGKKNAVKVMDKIAKAKNGDAIIVPSDKPIHFFETVEVKNKGIFIGTKYDYEMADFTFYHKDPAFVFTRSGPTTETLIKRINFLSRFNDDTIETGQDCIRASVPFRISQYMIENFKGTALKLTADVATKAAADISHANVSFGRIRSCENGIYAQGGDSNGIVFFHNAINDCKKVGVHDSSDTGSYHYGTMIHASGERNFIADGGGSRTEFNGCYSEGPSKYPDLFSGASKWSNGILGNGYEVHGKAIVQDGYLTSAMKFGEIVLSELKGMEFGALNVTNALFLNLMKNKGAFPHYGMHHMEGEFWQFFAASKQYPADYSGRQIPFASSGFKHIFIGDRLFITGTKDEVVKLGLEFKNGDTIFNSKFDGTNAERWVFVGSDWKEIKI